MVTEIDENKMRAELADVYRKYVNSPGDKGFHKEAMNLHEKYMHLVGHGLIPEAIEDAISNLTEIVQYGKGTIDDEKMLESGKEILKDLENNE